MKKLFAAAVIFYLAATLVPVIAQTQVPFWQWPALYSAAENLVAKRGVDRDGTPNGKVYLRIGWGGCLAVFEDEWSELMAATQADRYINLRAWAEQRLAEDTENIGWSADDSYNCPSAPLRVKPYYRGSRPTYEYVDNDGLWQRGRKSAYRVVATADQVIACERYNARKDDGSRSNYWMIADGQDVYIDEEVFQAGVDSLGVRLVTVCEDEDVSVEDYRW